jgi:hypothetical protein
LSTRVNWRIVAHNLKPKAICGGIAPALSKAT